MRMVKVHYSDGLSENDKQIIINGLNIQTRYLEKLLPEKIEHHVHKGYLGYANGNVFNPNTKTLSSNKPKSSGYIENQINRKSLRRHRFIYECYHQITLDPKYDIDHINGDTEDNSITNLQALTRKEHAIKTHGGKKARSVLKLSKKVIRYKLDKDNIRYDIKEYASLAEAENDSDVHKNNTKKYKMSLYTSIKNHSFSHGYY